MEHFNDMSLLCGVIFLIAALLMLAFVPKKINHLYGYRTARSKKSQQSWEFAQRFSSFRMIEGGVFMILVSAFMTQFSINPAVSGAIAFALIIGVPLYLFVRTERALQKKFPN